MGDSGDGSKVFEVFTGRVLENFKSKEHGAINLKKGATVLVLGMSADGDKCFGEVNKQRGWFPSMYVLKTGTPKPEELAPPTPRTLEVPTRKTSGEIPTSLSADSLRSTHTRGHSGGSEEKPVVPQLADLKRGAQMKRRGTGEFSPVRNASTPTPPLSKDALTQSLNITLSHSPTPRISPPTQQPQQQQHPQQPQHPQQHSSTSPSNSARYVDLELRRRTFQQQGATGRMFLSVGPTLGVPGKNGGGVGGLGGLGGGGDVADFVKNRKKSIDADLGKQFQGALATAGVSVGLSSLSSPPLSPSSTEIGGEGESKNAKETKKELREKEKMEKQLAKEQKKHAQQAKKHKKKAHKTKFIVFGVSLQDTMDRQKETYPDLQYPLILTSLCYAIMKLDGHTVEGIFRISGTASVLEELKYQLDKDNQVRIDDAHIAAGLLKLWLGMLPEPLVPANLHNKLLATVAVAEDSVKSVDELPDVNRKVVRFLIQFLQEKIVPYESTTLMSAENIAMVLAPNFFVSAKDVGLGDVLRETGQGIRFVVNLLTTMKFSTPLDFETEKKKVDLLIGPRGKVKDKAKVKMGIASPRNRPEKKPMKESSGQIPTRAGLGDSRKNSGQSADSMASDTSKAAAEKEKEKEKEEKEKEEKEKGEKDKEQQPKKEETATAAASSTTLPGSPKEEKEREKTGEKQEEDKDDDEAFAFG